MAQFFSPKANKKHSPKKNIVIECDSLDHQGLGVAHAHHQVIFVDGLLPGEQAQVQLVQDKGRFAKGVVQKRMQDSPQRIAPSCRYFGRCGGCQLQYATNDGQRQFKQQALQQLLQHHLKNAEFAMAAAISGADWHYRRRARLATHWHKGQLVVGFRQSQSKQVVAIEQCPVLAAQLSALIAPLGRCLAALALAKQLGHVDLLLADEGVVVVLRLLRQPNPPEQSALVAFGQQHQCQILWDDGQCVRDLAWQSAPLLHYQATVDGPSVAFLPGDFFQVNDHVNQQMVAQALAWLAPQPEETGLDLFCGGGNFSFALAQRAKQVVAVEGIDRMVLRGQAQAQVLALPNVQFYCADLNSAVSQYPWAQQTIDWVLLDPARAGASGALQWLPALAPKRILYVSCNPLTLAQDAKSLTEQGYRLDKLGLIDMFPHTGHLESMALFVRQ